MHVISTISRPFAGLLLGYTFFYLAVQRQLTFTRHLFGLLSVASIWILCLSDTRLTKIPFFESWIHFIVGLAPHTFALLFLDKRTLTLPDSASLTQRFHAVFWAFVNFRRLPEEPLTTISANPPKEQPQQQAQQHEEPTPNKSDIPSRLTFALQRGTYLLLLLLLNRLITHLTETLLLSLHLHPSDLSPSKQGLLPTSLSRRELTLRAVVSYHWIWHTYAGLAAPHALLSVLFVSVLRWDTPADWPHLHGSIAEAYSLRRFWGVFSHRLLVNMYDSYLELLGPAVRGKAARALGVFLCAALYHAAGNWAGGKGLSARGELRFFVANWVVCLAETVVLRGVRARLYRRWPKVVRGLGFVWVLGVFFALVPGWHYPLLI